MKHVRLSTTQRISLGRCRCEASSMTPPQLCECRIDLTMHSCTHLLNGLGGPICVGEVSWLHLSLLQTEAFVEQLVHILSKALLDAQKPLRLSRSAGRHNSGNGSLLS